MQIHHGVRVAVVVICIIAGFNSVSCGLEPYDSSARFAFAYLSLLMTPWYSSCQRCIRINPYISEIAIVVPVRRGRCFVLSSCRDIWSTYWPFATAGVRT